MTLNGTSWICGDCGGATSDEASLRDHQEWCLGDPEANIRLLEAVSRQTGELTQDELVDAAAYERGLHDEQRFAD